ncbi:MAG: beta-N-acetylhexosaminidase [Gammaproteobacteria bacterium]|nr:beta-N-acetylhexosaminidase [Gammaproteobacteria bacterium]MDH5803025.1 beta-N-acetylhexosaminidase [Gammaproteobacteria bacterium]
MSLGPVMMDLRGTAIDADEREMMQHPLVGGVILFTRNYESPQQIARLVTEIHNIRAPHLLVAVDHEGGRVQRFRDGFTRLPPVGELGVLAEKDIKQAESMAQTLGWLMAVELRAVGVDFSFAPVLDMDRNISDVIGDRAFHKEPDKISRLAQAYHRGMHQAGMASTGKHFPGHGSVKADSHVAFPVDHRQFADIEMEDMVPFERLIQNGLAAIMPAHVIYPAVDAHPAGFSRFWLQDVLRRRLGFQGVIFSDDLSMEAASVAGDVVARTQAALAAGCDMALVCNDTEAASKVLDGLGEYHEPVSQLRLIRMHGRLNRAWDSLRQDPQWQQALRAVEQFSAGDTLELDI